MEWAERGSMALSLFEGLINTMAATVPLSTGMRFLKLLFQGNSLTV